MYSPRQQLRNEAVELLTPPSSQSQLRDSGDDATERASTPEPRVMSSPDEAPKTIANKKIGANATFHELKDQLEYEIKRMIIDRDNCSQIVARVGEKYDEDVVKLKLEVESFTAAFITTNKRKRASSAVQKPQKKRQSCAFTREDFDDEDDAETQQESTSLDNALETHVTGSKNVTTSVADQGPAENAETVAGSDQPQNIHESETLLERAKQLTEEIRVDLIRIPFPSLLRMLKTHLRSDEATQRNAAPLFDMLSRKYRDAHQTQRKRKINHRAYPTTSSAQNALFGRFTSPDNSLIIEDEEQLHPWSVIPSVNASEEISCFEGALFRLWWFKSECLLHHGIGLLAGSSDRPLRTAAERNIAIGDHANWGNRTKTPFISFTRSPEFIERIAKTVTSKETERGITRSTARLTLVNPKARLARGFAVLGMKEEIKWYKVEARCAGSVEGDKVYEHEYLLPYVVGVNEIVGTWLWRDVVAWCEKKGKKLGEWYEIQAKPRLEKHEEARLKGEKYELEGGRCVCCHH